MRLSPDVCSSHTTGINKTSEGSIHRLPEELFFKIFAFLSHKDLSRVACVNKNWSGIASDSSLWNAFDVKKLFPSLTIIDETVWKSCFNLDALGLSVEEASPINTRETLSLLKKNTSLDIEENAGVTLLTIPQGLNFETFLILGSDSIRVKNLNLRTSRDLEGNIKIQNIWSRIFQELGQDRVKKSYRIAITNSVLKESREVSANEAFFFSEKLRCDLPRALEVTALLFMTFLHSQKRICKSTPSTYALCSEKIDGYHLIVGGFSQDGFNVSCCYVDMPANGIGLALRLS